MYSFIKGTIYKVYATHIVVECHDIGYLIKVPNPYSFSEGSTTWIHLHQIVKEDAIELYGFMTDLERDMFVKLINVKGLGPKGALAIIASSSPTEIIENIKQKNDKFFSKFPGIGPKSSQQIILDLNGKVDFTGNVQISKNNEKLNNTILALKSLGYSMNEIKSATANFDFNDDTSLSDVIKIMLRKLSK